MEEKYSGMTASSNNNVLETKVKKEKTDWVNINVKVRNSDLPILNQRLKLLGFETLGQLTKELVNGTFPHVTEEKQIDNLYKNDDKSGQKSLLEGGYNRDFYERANTMDMYDYYINVRKFHKNTCRDLISYFKRFRDIFFSIEQVDQIRALTPRVRSKVMDAMRKFGAYYLFRYNNEQCIDLVEKIIRRHNLSAGQTEHGKLYIVDDNYLEERLKQLFSIGEGEISTIIKFGMFSGLREDEMIHVYNKNICPDLSGCTCTKLHVIDKPNGVSVVLIQWHRGHKKCYFTLVPTAILKVFKAMDAFEYRPHIRSAHEYMKVKTKDDKITFMWLRKAHYNVMCRVMKPFEANVLAGRAKSVDAKHYAMYELNEMSEKYAEAWKKFNISAVQ
jgi:intergrase/recombinase